MWMRLLHLLVNLNANDDDETRPVVAIQISFIQIHLLIGTFDKGV